MMASHDCSSKELDKENLELVVKFVTDLRNGKYESSQKVALATIQLLEQIIKSCKNATQIELCGAVRAAGRVIARAQPQQLVAANMARRVLRAVRDEFRALAHQGGDGALESLHSLVRANSGRRGTLAGAAPTDLRESITDHIHELYSELENTTISISGQASEHIQVDEVVLTYGCSSLAEKFLRKAAHDREYRLVIAEGTDVKGSHAMAARLSGAGLHVTVISNEAIFAVMSRVNKVVVSVKAVLASQVLGAAGLHMVTLAAKHYAVQVFGLAPLYKLSPLHTCDQHLPAPQALPYESCESGTVHTYSPSYDFIPPDHFVLFITNLGGSSPSYIYRLLSEMYDPHDYQL